VTADIALAASTTGGGFIVTYATADGVEGNTGEYIGKVFTLE
jgi:hypothetical protein